MLTRTIQPELLARLDNYPAVALVGPRQCGKTTLAQSFEGHYFDLEQEGDRLRLDLAWDDVISGNQLLILDEFAINCRPGAPRQGCRYGRRVASLPGLADDTSDRR